MSQINNYTVNLTSKRTLPDLDYINELANEKGFVFGRNFLKVPKILEDLYFLFYKCNEDPDTFDQKNFIFSSAYIESDVIFEEMNSAQQAYYKYTLKFLSDMDFNIVPGLSPMDKALNTVMYITHLSSVTNTKNQQGYTNDPKGNGKVNVDSEEQLAKAVEEMSKGISTEDGNSERTDQDVKKEMTQCVRDHLYDLNPTIAHIYGKTRPSDVPINTKILKDIQVKSYLENTKGLETATEVTKKRNNNSAERKRLQMEEHSQITKVKKQDIAMETFDDRFVKKELTVKEKVKPETKKQMLYMLLDDSGSMCNETKLTYVRAVLLNRLESVANGTSTLKFALYENDRYMFHEVTDKDHAKVLFRTISTKRPGGGGTNIGAVLQDTIDDIHNVPGHHDPEIMIVCDGDDHVDPKLLDFKGVRINAVLLGRDNKGIKAITKATKGFYTVEKFYN